MSLLKRYSDLATQGKKVNHDSRPRSKVRERVNVFSDGDDDSLNWIFTKLFYTDLHLLAVVLRRKDRLSFFEISDCAARVGCLSGATKVWENGK